MIKQATVFLALLSVILVLGGEVDDMMEKWKVDSYVKTLTSSPQEEASLLEKIKKEIEKEIKLSKLIKAKKSSKFVRSTDISILISENYRIMRCIQDATEDFPEAEEMFMNQCRDITEDESFEQCPSSCDVLAPFRSIEGCCNNINQPENGRAPKPFARSLDAAYEDGKEVPRGGVNPSTLPNARSVSRAVHRPQQGEKSTNATLMLMQFGQFLDHDITLTPEPEAECCEEELREEDVCFNIDSSTDRFFLDKKECLPFSRSDAICQPGPREQINLLTAFVDGSNIYGSDSHTAEALRTKTDGLLRTHELGPTLPTRQDAELESEEHQNPMDLVAGDIRATENPGLASIHSMFVAEHNRIARILKSKNADLEDEELYEISRSVVSAELQNIVYSEFLPVVLGEQEMVNFNLRLPEDDNTVYDPTVVADVTNEFATAAFRFGHSLIPNSILVAQEPVRTKTISCPIKDTFFTFEEFNIGSDLSGKAWQNMVRGIATQDSPRFDSSINHAVLDYLFCGENCALPGGFGQDLAARNIQRGREHGLNPYTEYRVQCGLEALTDWANRPDEISEEDWRNMEKVYTNVGDIDLFVGGLSEISNDDGLVGPTFGCLIGSQFEKLLSGDRFFFTHKSSGAQNERGLPPRTKTSIRKRTLGDIICDNTDAVETTGKVMEISSGNDATKCSNRIGLDFDAILEEMQVNQVQVAPVDVKISSSHTCSTGQCGPGKAKYCADGVGTTICHTRHGADNFPWIALEFSAPVQVTKVEILNSQSQWKRIGTVDVRITDSLPTDGQTMFSGGELFGRFTGPGTIGGVVTLEETPKQGTVVLIQRNKGQHPDEVLILSDIKVFTSRRSSDDQSPGDCPDGWLMYEGHCYGHPEDNKLSWADAESYCQSWSAGAHLASIHSAEEQKFVQDNFPRNIWLGGSDVSKEGSWVWSDGTFMAYSNWRGGEPNNCCGGQDCLQGNWHAFQWDDDNCTSENLFVCKK